MAVLGEGRGGILGSATKGCAGTRLPPPLFLSNELDLEPKPLRCLPAMGDVALLVLWLRCFRDISLCVWLAPLPPLSDSISQASTRLSFTAGTTGGVSETTETPLSVKSVNAFFDLRKKTIICIDYSFFLKLRLSNVIVAVIFAQINLNLRKNSLFI